MLTTTATAPLLIKAFEGFRSQTYFDSAGVPTIGFGVTTYSNGDPVMPGDEITEDEAEAELFHHIRNEVEPVMNLHFENLPLQPNQRDALASFLYNLGGDSNKWPSLKKAIEKGKSDAKIADQWMRYTRAGGKVVLGLHRRRLAEVLVWLGIPWQRAVDLSQEAGLDDGWRDFAPEQVSEPQIDSELFEEGPITDPTPDTPLTTKDLNIMQAESLKTGRKMSFEPIMPVGTKPLSINTKMAADVPYGIDPDAGLQPKEEAERVRRYTKKIQGVEMKQVGQGLTVTTGVIAGANELAGETTTLFDKLGVVGVTLMSLAFGVGILYWVVGFIREKWNARKEVEAEINATQGIY